MSASVLGIDVEISETISQRASYCGIFYLGALDTPIDCAAD